MVNHNFFPTIIQQVILSDSEKPKIIEVPFELESWVNPNLLNEFGLEMITKAVSNLQYSFRKLREIKTVSIITPKH